MMNMAPGLAAVAARQAWSAEGCPLLDDGLDEEGNPIPPPADPRLLALANRALGEQLDEARAEVERLRAQLRGVGVEEYLAAKAEVSRLRAEVTRLRPEQPPVQWVREHYSLTWHLSIDADGLGVLCGRKIPGSPLVLRQPLPDECARCAACMSHPALVGVGATAPELPEVDDG
jgi:hypothetical protein